MPSVHTFGIFAHVDAGKTTLSEQLLFQSGAIRKFGRVDHGNTVLDADSIEQQRGITVFADQADFQWKNQSFTMIDTPGHIDFTAEAERSIPALDFAVLLLDGASRLQAHTVSLFHLLESYSVPTLIFINKTDSPAWNQASILQQISAKLTSCCVPVSEMMPDEDALSYLDDDYCESVLEGTASDEETWSALAKLFRSRKGFPVLMGSALGGKGVAHLLDVLAKLASFLPEPADEGLKALVYKVRRDSKGERIVFLKLLSGSLRPRDSFQFGEVTEKPHQLRHYNGKGFVQTEEAYAGETLAVTGLTVPKCGDIITANGIIAKNTMHTQPVLYSRVESTDGTSDATLYEKLRILEDEDPLLGCSLDSEHRCLLVQIMGTVQTEILTQILKERFGIAVRFLPPLVLYRETVAAPKVGCGHYEPLRHYAECHLRLSPAPRGSGITYESLCHVDDLPIAYQSQVRAHVLEKVHKGVLIGAPLTDVHIQLLSGKAHLKHTEGGDFREAVYRAVRQGLKKADCRILEPYYRFAITLPEENAGKVMTDLSAMAGTTNPPERIGTEVMLTGRVPVSSFMSYPSTLRAITHGKGQLQLQPDGYDLCHNADEVIGNANYRAEADTANSCGSVFCSHGAGYSVNWDEADALMHLPVETM